MALAAPYALSAGEVAIGASIGIAEGRPTDTVAELLHRADAAMYEAKAGRATADTAAH